MGKPFVVRFSDDLDGKFYQRRRVIIKNDEKLMKGMVNIKSLLDIFINKNYLNPSEYIHNIQLGIEVTSGYGAVKFNRYNLDM